MHQHHTTTLDPLPDVTTLDGDRADRFGTFLTVEAAADAATMRSAHRSPRRRIAVGTVAAGALAAGLIAVTGVVGGPGPAAVSPAVAIEQADGWTTISITDPTASPTQIAAALEAAGIEASVSPDEPIHLLPGQDAAPDPGPISFFGAGVTIDGDGTDDEPRGYYSVTSFADAEPGDLSAVSLDFALSDHEVWSDGATIETIPVGPGEQPVADLGPFEDAMGELGVKVGGDLPDGTVSIQDGADVTVVLSAR